MKNLKKLGKTLNKMEQKAINGGLLSGCPQQGGTCSPGQAVHCISSDVYCCIDGQWNIGGAVCGDGHGDGPGDLDIIINNIGRR